jgi:hypothetical protein
MPMKDRTTCAVPECGAPISGFSNLCDSHGIPGAIARLGENSMVIAAWAVEHGNECGIVFVNDFAAGDLFGGRPGFEAKLREQGFVNVRLLRTPQEVEAAKQPAEGKKAGDWGGPWRTKYPWEVAKALDRSGDPARDDASSHPADLPEPTDHRKPDEMAPIPATTIPEGDHSAPKQSPDNSVTELLVSGHESAESGVPQLGDSLCGKRCLLLSASSPVAGQNPGSRGATSSRTTLRAARHAAALASASAAGTLSRKSEACHHGEAATDSLSRTDSIGAGGGTDSDSALIPQQATALGL